MTKHKIEMSLFEAGKYVQLKMQRILDFSLLAVKKKSSNLIIKHEIYRSCYKGMLRVKLRVI